VTLFLEAGLGTTDGSDPDSQIPPEPLAQTMIVEVYHRQHSPNGAGYDVFEERPDVDWADRQKEYECSATVDVQAGDHRDALRRVLRIMRHKPSTADSGAVVKLCRDSVRRSSIGDVFVVDGVAYEVQDGGFERI
jgi:hypothetical protein